MINSGYDMPCNFSTAQGGATIRMGRVARVWKSGCNYHPNGLKKTYTTPEGATYTYYYNKNNQFTAVHIPGSGQLSRGNFYWLQPQTLLLPGGSQVTLSYDDFLQVKERILQDPEQTNIAEALYDYDAVGDITAIDTEHGEYSFGYDSLYRLTDADYPLDVAANDEEFGYDGVGNRTTHTQATEEDEQERTSATYNSLNQLISQIQNGVETTFTYNANGHTATKTTGSDTTEYIYNHEERLIAVKRNGQTLGEYAYNPLGQRIKKTVNGQTTWYLYNDEGLAAEYNVSGQLIAEYHFTPYSTWMTEPLFQRKSGQVYYYQNDHLGTPQRMVNSTGEVVWEARYEAFGEAEIVTDVVTNNLRFPGQYYDGETGLHHNYFRDYDSETGRYVQADPIGLDGGINTYAFAMSNPLGYIDSLGLSVESFDHAWRPANANTGYGLFGMDCGPASDPRKASQIPDGLFTYACKRHDKCYETCGKSKLMCDIEFFGFTGMNVIYTGAVLFSDDARKAYEEAQKKACEDCDEN